MRLTAFLVLVSVTGLLGAQTPEGAVRAVLDEQAAAWNEGDLQRFVRTYAPEATFVGKEVSQGAAALLDRYERTYPTRDRMGTLRFTILEVHLLGAEYASVIGRFHLERTAAAGGPADGIFTLLLRHSGKTWKIILDHTS
jgi:uncharacterized protein (TIGR02246 family)